MLHENIAVALEISIDTLRKYYQSELAVGSTRRRMDVLQAMYRAATTKGSTSAAKVYLANEPQMAVPPLPKESEAPAPAPASVPVAAPKLGKKDQANLDAVTAATGTDWADLLPGGASAPRTVQ